MRVLWRQLYQALLLVALDRCVSLVYLSLQ